MKDEDTIVGLVYNDKRQGLVYYKRRNYSMENKEIMVEMNTF